MARYSAAHIHRLRPGDSGILRSLLDMFGEAFGERETYSGAQPGEDYLESLLRADHFIAVAVLVDDAVAGGLVAYELRKFEQERSEIYIYDLAVAKQHHRRGIATDLIAQLKAIARERGAYVIYIQADLTDAAAIALYSKLGKREDVLHFDIAVT